MIFMVNENKDSVIRVNKFMIENNKKPLQVRVDKDNLKIEDYLNLNFMKDGLKRINDFIHKNNKYPSFVTILDIKINEKEYKLLFGNKIYLTHNKKSDKGDEVVEYFKKVFGNFKTFDEALRLVKNKGYAHYYDPHYSNKTSIDRIKKGLGINCSDSCELFYHIGKYLGYKTDVLHVKCSSGEGHVRMRLKKGNNTYYRDPACVLSVNDKSIDANWCDKNYKLLAVNPSWLNYGDGG